MRWWGPVVPNSCDCACVPNTQPPTQPPTQPVNTPANTILQNQSRIIKTIIKSSFGGLGIVILLYF